MITTATLDDPDQLAQAVAAKEPTAIIQSSIDDVDDEVMYRVWWNNFRTTTTTTTTISVFHSKYQTKYMKTLVLGGCIPPNFKVPRCPFIY